MFIYENVYVFTKLICDSFLTSINNPTYNPFYGLTLSQSQTNIHKYKSKSYVFIISKLCSKSDIKN